MKTDAEVLKEYTEIDAEQWAACDPYDKDDARGYRREFFRLLKKYCGRYDEIGYRGELEYYVKCALERKEKGTLKDHIRSVSANDYYLENLEIITETINEAEDNA